jgi:hypothetical protein
MNYADLYREIPEAMQKFSYEDFRTSEQTVIKPALEDIGYTDIKFSMGERDSFGPLSRIVTCKDGIGQTIRFIYG